MPAPSSNPPSHRLPTDTDDGMLLIISGPSGVGKTSVTRGVERSIPDAVFSVSMSFVGLERLGITANLGPRAAAKLIACCAPLILFGASYLSIVSGFAKSYREAQTYLGLVITLPTMPLLFAGLLGLQAKLPLMLVPFLSQHLLMTTVVRAEPIEPALMVVSVASTLVYGVLLMWLAGRLYRREGLLG